jgi:hypothetical protein
VVPLYLTGTILVRAGQEHAEHIGSKASGSQPLLMTCILGCMTPEDFVGAIKQLAFDPAVQDSALQPRGQRPHEVLTGIWDWYTALPERDRTMVRQAMRIAAYRALFRFFALLDGSAVADDPPHGELRLEFVDPDGNERQLNIPESAELHELWAGVVFPFTEPLPGPAS